MSTRKPIYVFEGGGSNPHVIATIDTDKFSDHDSKAETAIVSRKVNNISTIEITIPTNCEASKLITNTSDLVLFDSKGNIQEFHITDIDDMDEYSVNRTIYAEQSFGELINNIVTGDTAMPTTTNPSDYLAYILSFTRWSVGTVDTSIYNAKWEEDLTGLTCLEAFQKLVEKYNCEFEVRYTIDGKNKITGRYVDLKKKIGNSYGKRFEDKKDIIGLKRNLDLDSIKTAIYPRIKIETQDENGNNVTTYIDISTVAWSVAKGDPVDKPLGQTVLVNPEADEIYKRYNTKTGNLMEKIMYAEWTGDTASDAEDLCRQAWSILKANGVLTPTIEVTASDLYRMSGNDPEYSHEQVDLGDTCIIIDKNFDPELRITTRVMEIEEDILNPINNTYVFGNYRKTLATSNIESQKSIEEQLIQLQDKIQGITIPEYTLPYQSGAKYYSDVKEQVQNEFMSASGYVMAQDSDGFWVFDAPVTKARATAYPTKATILKGGCLALAEYNTVTSAWEVGTFINGTSVNADYITTGHLSAEVISAGSITTDHLNTAAIEYIKAGMATEDDLQGVINSVANTYATKDSVSSSISSAVDGLASEVKIDTVKDLQKQLQAEYNENYAKANKVYDDQYLPAGSTARVNLGSKMTAYTTAYNNYNNYINTMISDGAVTDAEYNQYNTYATAYATAVKNLAEAIEDANSARLSNVYAQARQGLVTTADLEVNNQSVIASAKAGMVSTGDMTASITAATQNLVSNSALNSAIDAIKIGGTNLAKQTKKLTSKTGDVNWNVTSTGTEGFNKLHLNSTSTNWVECQIPLYTEINTLTSPVTVSFEYQETTAGLLLFSFAPYNGNTRLQELANKEVSSSFTLLATRGGWKYVSYTFDPSSLNGQAGATHYCLQFKKTNGKTGEISVRKIKIEIGNKATEWTPAPEDVTNDSTMTSRIESIRQSYNAITTEYKNSLQQANTLYTNSYLGGTAKTNLNTAKSDYTTKYNAVTTAYNNAVADAIITVAEVTAWDTALTNLQSSTTTLAQRVQEASTFINTAVYNASKNYTDTAIPDALTGYATTSYVNSAKADAIADAKKGMVSSSQLEVNNTEILLKTSKMGQYNLLRNSDFRSGTDYWVRYDGSKAPDYWGVVNDSDVVVIAGERCMRTWISSGNGAVVWNGFYQDVTLAANTSYTLSYWLSNFQCTSRVSVWKGTNNDNTIAYKTYSSPINGNHNRESWKYDSITFTTSTAGTYRMFFQTKDAPSSGGYGLFLIKPMLCTGINAQAWTAHPDEIHVGVVSVTEQNGIKVEHSDFSTYSVLNAAGLKVLTNSNSLVASFGESGSAYIGDLTCDGYVKSPQVMPVSKKVNGGIVEIYCSETGSGNQSGDSSNYVMGWAGAMRKVLDYLGIDYTHTDGRFIINSNTSNKSNLVFRIYVKGATFTNNIELYNIYGHALFQIYFDSGCKYTGQMRFYNLEPFIDIGGSGKAVLSRGSSITEAIYCYNVSQLYLHSIYVNYTSFNSSNYPIYAYNTDCYFTSIDFCNCANMVNIEGGFLRASQCVGSMTNYVANGDLSFVNLSSSKVPAVSNSASPFRNAVNVSTETSFTPTSSAQQGSQAVTINVTKTFNALNYASFRTATYRSGILVQGAANESELNKFGNYYARIYFNSSAFAEAMNTINNAVVQLYIQRKSAISSSTDYTDVYIDGSHLGILHSETGNWFDVPSSAIYSLKNGSGYIELNATGVSNYTEYYPNAVLKITGTQTR